MTIEQKMRYKELMWIAKEGDYMSQAEFDELSMLIKMNGYKQSATLADRPVSYPQSYPQGSAAISLRLFKSYARFSHFPYFWQFRGVGLCYAEDIERKEIEMNEWMNTCQVQQFSYNCECGATKAHLEYGDVYLSYLYCSGCGKQH